MPRPRLNPERPLTGSEKTARWKERKEREQEQEWSQVQAVVREAAELCRLSGLPFETYVELAQSLERLQAVSDGHVVDVVNL
jgi:hypothetical protein